MGSHASDGPSLDRALAHARHILPAQGPIGNFVHHNTLHAFQHEPFHEAVRHASDVYGTQGYLSETVYRAALAEGRVDEDDLEDALERYDAHGVKVDRTKLSARDVRRILLVRVK